jgi:hypothetical protein
MTNEYIHSIELEGQTFTRKSPRVYTHAVVGRTDVTSIIRRASEVSMAVRQNAQYYVEIVAGTHHQASWDAHRAGCATIKDEAIQDGWTTDLSANIKKMVAMNVASAKSWAGDGKLQVLQWSMSANNAQKGLRTIANRGCHLNLTVVPVTSRVPATKRQQEIAQ